MTKQIGQVPPNFPFECVTVNSSDALSTWESLKHAGRGSPVIIEDSLKPGDGVEGLVMSLGWAADAGRDASKAIEAARSLVFPDALAQLKELEWAARVERLSQLPGGPELLAIMEEVRSAPPEPVVWPEPSAPVKPTAAVTNDNSAARDELVQIALLPTDDPTTIPAHLLIGGWNSCPAPQYHVAALRSWRDRYGAELVGVRHDVLWLRVARRPETRDEALRLADELYEYCVEINSVSGGIGDLAANLMVSDRWYFWWD